MTGRGWKIAGTMEAAELEKAAGKVFAATAIVILTASAVGAVLVTAIVFSITRPLSGLLRATEKIGNGGLTERVEVHEKFMELSSAVERVARGAEEATGLSGHTRIVRLPIQTKRPASCERDVEL